MPKVELLEQGKPREITDIKTGLKGVGAVGPGKVVNILIAFLQSPLGAAEVRARDKALRVNHAGERSLVR